MLQSACQSSVLCWFVQNILSILWGGYMITLRELRTMSLEFRRVSSNFLNCDHDTADIALSRFYSYLKRTEWIWDFISDILTTTEFDFRDCFPNHSNGWREASIPVDEKQHFKAQFDYLEFLAERTPVNVLGEAMQYYHSSKKFTDIIQSFAPKAPSPCPVVGTALCGCRRFYLISR